MADTTPFPEHLSIDEFGRDGGSASSATAERKRALAAERALAAPFWGGFQPRIVATFVLCAVAWVAAPHLFTTRPVHAAVNLSPGPDRGRTIIDRWGRNGLAPNVTLLDTLDADGFFALLTARLPTLP